MPFQEGKYQYKEDKNIITILVIQGKIYVESTNECVYLKLNKVFNPDNWLKISE